MLNILLVILALALLLVLIDKLSLSPEVSRKAVHLGMGLICLTFPWLFSTNWHVDLLAALAVATLLFIRCAKPPLGKVLHEIERLSFGELLFPIGTAIVFRLANGDLDLYFPAIGVLTFADTAGALIGALKIIIIATVSFQWWFTPIAAISVILTIPLTSSLKRPEQAILAFLFSLLALIP